MTIQNREPVDYLAGEMPLHRYCTHHAQQTPERIALLWYGRTICWRELDQLSTRLAVQLQRLGVARGDRVALYLQNCPQYLVAFYAVMRADAVVVPVNPMNRADEFGHYITDPDTKVVVCGADGAEIGAVARQGRRPVDGVVEKSPDAVAAREIVGVGREQFEIVPRVPRRACGRAAGVAAVRHWRRRSRSSASSWPRSVSAKAVDFEMT